MESADASFLIIWDRFGPRSAGRSSTATTAGEEQALQWVARAGTLGTGESTEASPTTAGTRREGWGVLPWDRQHRVMIQSREVGPCTWFWLVVIDHATYREQPDPVAWRAANPWPELPSPGSSGLQTPGTISPAQAQLTLRRPDADELKQLLAGQEADLVLGAAQALVEGSRFGLVRPAPIPGYCESLAACLPDSIRAEWTFISFAAQPTWACDTFIAAIAPDPWPWPALKEDAIRDYPLGRYEQALRAVLDAGDVAAYNGLMARRSPRQTLQLAAGLVLLALLFAIVNRLL